MLSLLLLRSTLFLTLNLLFLAFHYIRLATIVFIHLHRYEFLDILIHLLRILRARRQDYLNQV